MLTEKQIEARSKGIGGSDAAAVMGFSPFRSAFEVWLEKTGRHKFEPTKETHPWLYWGHMLEDIVAKEYSKVTGYKVRNRRNTSIHKEHKWMLGHPDRFVVGQKKILECKIARESTANKDWGTGADEVKQPYIIQVQHYMAITGSTSADIAVLIGNSDFRKYEIPRDDELIEMIIDQCGSFYKKHIVTDIPPPPVDGKDALLMWPTDTGIYREAISEETALCTDYKELRGLKKEIDMKLKDVADKIKISIQDLSGLEIDGKKIATYKENKKGSRTLLIK